MVGTIVSNDQQKTFGFDEDFLHKFDKMSVSYNELLDAIHKCPVTKEDKYVICRKMCKVRYILPEDISTYVSNVISAINNQLIDMSVTDFEMFAVTSAKRFIDKNGCDPFEDSTLSGDNGYINPKNLSLIGLLTIVDGDICENELYSGYEMIQRYETSKELISTFDNMHFTAAIKNVIEKLPQIITSKAQPIVECEFYNSLLQMFVQKFILFALSLNITTLKNIIEYVTPNVVYATMKNDENAGNLNVTPTILSGVVTECYNYTSDIRCKIPFNCDMKTVVLGDTSTKFKDVENALEFLVHDSRSPLQMMLVEYLPKDKQNCDLITHAFVQAVINQFRIDENNAGVGKWFYNRMREEKMYDPYKEAGFNTSSEWLDTIVSGNNYLDGDYRQDAMGNNARNPIVNTLQMIHKAYKPCCKMPSSKLAENIMCIYYAMKEIINRNKDTMIMNYDLVRDILAVLGDEFNRTMMILIDKNMPHRVSCDVNMNDTLSPAYLYTECAYFVVEDGEQQSTGGDNTPPNLDGANNATQQNQQNNTNNNNQQQNKQAEAQKKSLRDKIKKVGNVIKKLIDWLMSKFANFANEHMNFYAPAVKWINSRQQFNEEMCKFFTDHPDKMLHLIPYAKFKVPAKDILNNISISSVVMKYLRDGEKVFEKDGKIVFDEDAKMKVLRELLPPAFRTDDICKAENFTKQNGENLPKIYSIVQNYLCFSIPSPTVETDQMKNNEGVDASADVIKDIIDDIKSVPEMVKAFSAKYNKELRAASSELLRESNKTLLSVDSKNAESAELIENHINLVNGLQGVLQTLINIFTVPVANNLKNNVFKVRYKAYCDIVAHYNNEKKNLSENDSASQNNNSNSDTQNSGNGGENNQ